jgi:NDP-sugar pyrophosphorylase family protein
MTERPSIQLVIPAAGIGSRFRVTGESTPKPLIQVFDIPMVLWVISNFQILADDRVILICREEDSIERKLSKDFPKVSSRIDFVTIHEVTDGPATTIMRALNLLDLDAPLVVANSDQFVKADLKGFLDATTSTESHGTILTMNASGTKWSYLTRDRMNGNVNLVVEKKEISNEATVGIYGWKKAVYFVESYYEMQKADDRVNGELYVAPSFNYMINKGQSISAINVGNVESEVYGLGTPEDLAIFLNSDEIKEISRKVAPKYLF